MGFLQAESIPEKDRGDNRQIGSAFCLDIFMVKYAGR
jgi:hypothetical protein